MSEPAAFFEEEGDRFGPTVLTRGPWRPEHQHGGPPSALAARAIERAAVWMRQRVPLVLGETPSPAQRILLMADSGSGVGAMLDPARLVPFINADLNVSLHRLPDGEWMGLDAVTTIEPHGVGLTRTGLFDVRGPIGQGLQALVAGQMGSP